MFASHPASQASDQKQYFIFSVVVFTSIKSEWSDIKVRSLFLSRHSAIIAPLCAALPRFQVQRPNCCSLRHKRASEPLLFAGQQLRFPLKHSASGVAINAALHSRPNNTIRGGRAWSEPIRSEQRLAAGARRRSRGGLCCHGYWRWNTNQEVWRLSRRTAGCSQWPTFTLHPGDQSWTPKVQNSVLTHRQSCLKSLFKEL